MPRGYWRYILAALGLVTVAGLGAVTGQLYDASQQRQSDYNYQPASKARFVQILPSQTKPEGYKPHCNNPQTNEDADLCAQWAAVSQVGESNRLASLNLKFAIASLWATFIATLLLLWTLIESRESSRRELRAYVSVDFSALHVSVTDLGMVGEIKLKNGGQTPAYNLCHCGNIVALTDEAAEKEFTRKDARAHLGRAAPFTLHTGEVANGSIPTHTALSEETLKAVANEELGLFVFGTAFYDDTFGRKRETRFCFKAEGMQYPMPKRVPGPPGRRVVPMTWTLAPFHNDAT